MKLTERTRELLSNFSKINQSLTFHKGHVLRTVSNSQNMYANMHAVEKFETEFSIYDLKKFLGALSLFDDPEIEIKDNYCVIKQDKRKLNYVFCTPNLIKSPPADKNIFLKDEIFKFELSKTEFKDTVKVLNVMKFSELTVTASEGEVLVRCTSVINDTGDLYSYKVGEISDKTKFDIHFKTETMNLLIDDLDYQISLHTGKGNNVITKITGADIEYYLTCEVTSKIG